jgi:flagellar protein FliS
MFTLTLEASHAGSAQQLRQVIGYVQNVRAAWVVAARDPEAGRVLPRELRTREEKFVPAVTSDGEAEAVGTRLSA